MLPWRQAGHGGLNAPAMPACQKETPMGNRDTSRLFGVPLASSAAKDEHHRRRFRTVLEGVLTEHHFPLPEPLSVDQQRAEIVNICVSGAGHDQVAQRGKKAMAVVAVETITGIDPQCGSPLERIGCH